MFLNIITPCSRPENLQIISSSINIPKENYRWIVIFDMFKKPDNIPENCESYCFKDSKSIVGNAQRNFALNLIKDGHIYFNDDDTVIHKDLWENIKYLDEDFISFMQESKNKKIRLKGSEIRPCKIDSHNFIVSKNCSKNIKWNIEIYEADGLFASECYKEAQTKMYIEKVLSTYNALR
jgi:hypothetical protein